jgi:hypothetical protein
VIEPPPTRPAPAGRTHPVVYAIVGVIALVIVGLVVVSLGTTQRHASFSFVGSAIRPTADAGPRAPAEAAPQPPAPPAKVEPAALKAEPADRKIIYTARVDLVVKNLDDAEKQVDDLLAANGGRLVRSESRGDAGAKRTASYTLEVPSQKFRALVGGLRKMGVPERDSVDSQDVTEEYVDLQVRVKHLKAEEENLLKILTEKTRTVEEALSIRRQIQPLREAIERAEGRQKFIEAKAALSTVTLHLREEANYVPPTVEPPPSPPTFGERAAGTFTGSWNALVAVGQALALVAVAVGPWLPFVVPLGFVGYWVARRLGGQVAPQAVRVPAADGSIGHAPPG